MGTFVGAEKSGEKEDSILEVEYRFGSVGSGESKIAYTHLYPNQGAFSIKIQDSGNW
jgi:hypothetical protein